MASSVANSRQVTRPLAHYAALVVLVILFLGRLGLASLVYARPDLAVANDTDRYVPIANAILSGTALVPNPARTGLLLNTVGYPVFLAAVYLLLGHAPGDVALAQLAISGGLALILYVVLRRRVGLLPALVSSLVLMVDPLTILWSMTVLTETLFAVVLGLAAVTITAWATSASRTQLILAGFLSALATLIKPYALIIVGIWMVALIFHPRGVGESWYHTALRGLQRALLFAAPTLLLVLPWVIRNSVIWHCPSLSSVDRVTMRDYVAGKVLSEAEHLPLDQVQAELQASDPGVCPQHTAEYINIVLTHPTIYAKLHLAGTIPVLIGTNFDRWFQYFGIEYTLPDLWGPFMDGGLVKLLAVIQAEWLRFPQGLTVMLLMILFQMALYALAVMGLLASREIESAAVRWSIIALASAVLVLVVTPGQGGNERFRVPAQPLLGMLAAYGVAWKLVPYLRRRNRGVSSDNGTS